MKIKIEIKNRFTGKIIFELETENNTTKNTLLEAIKSGADLSYADLRYADLSGANLSEANLIGADLSEAKLIGADLSYADLSGADLSGANLSEADLSGANLSEANLSGAKLRYAKLRYAKLRYADLSGANLSEANLTGADLSGANLSEANLIGADLSGADLTSIKADLFLILLNAKYEVPGLKQALMDGKVDGSTYTGECACLVGTIANVKKCSYEKLPGIKPDSGRPAEKWFLNIREDHTPENSQFAKITLGWIDEFLKLIA